MDLEINPKKPDFFVAKISYKHIKIKVFGRSQGRVSEN